MRAPPSLFRGSLFASAAAGSGLLRRLPLEQPLAQPDRRATLNAHCRYHLVDRFSALA